MSKRRIQYEDKESELSVFLLNITYTEALDEKVFIQEAHRLENLFNMIFLGGDVYVKEKMAALAIAVINKKLTDEEAEARCRKYDEMMENEGISGTELDSEVPPRKQWQPHRYSADKLNSISAFMHDFNWNVGYRSLLMSKKEPECRPRVRRRYVSLMVSLDELPSHFGEETASRIKAKLRLVGREHEVKLGEEEVWEGGGIIGDKAFVERVAKDAGVDLTRRKQLRRIHLLPSSPSGHLTGLDELTLRAICKAIYDSPLYNDVKELLLHFMNDDPRSYCILGKTLLFGAPMGTLWLLDGILKWVTERYLMEDEKLNAWLESCGIHFKNTTSPETGLPFSPGSRNCANLPVDS